MIVLNNIIMSKSSNPPNSVWPNGLKVDSEGYAIYYPLGTNKIDISTVEWPVGDKIVTPFVYENNKLVGFCDTKAMTVSGNTTITMPYEYIDVKFTSIGEGELTVNAPNATYKKFKWNPVVINFKYKGCKTVNDVKAIEPNYLTVDIVDGVWSESLKDLESGNSNNSSTGMFYNCWDIKSFKSDLSSLINGEYMFEYSSQLEFFDADLSSLTDCRGMFNGCVKLSSFKSDLSSLVYSQSLFRDRYNLTSFDAVMPNLDYGDEMFNGCTSLSSFSSNLSSLYYALRMFDGCSNLTSFNVDMPKLEDGRQMFYDCSSLTSFDADLSSLNNGAGMFYGCKLDTDSIQNIAEKINDVNDLVDEGSCGGITKFITIGIANKKPNTRETKAFDEIVTKGWTVYVNGSEYIPSMGYSIITLDENGEEISTPVPYYAKPIISDEEHGDYVDSEGNYYNILGGQFIYGDDLSSYGMFTCEDDAAANMRLTKIVKEEL